MALAHFRKMYLENSSRYKETTKPISEASKEKTEPRMIKYDKVAKGRVKPFQYAS
jgi:hypothetical protein